MEKIDHTPILPAIIGVWSKMSFLKRILNPSLSKSFFLFGARNTGKSTLLRWLFREQKVFWVDLLDPEEEEKYARSPGIFREEVLALSQSTKYVVIDEIQKIPKFLDLVHFLIEKTNKVFVLTGSSTRKLRYGGANLLAGRAFVRNLYPFTSLEAGEGFSLDEALEWGTLPSVLFAMKTAEDKAAFLRAYAQTYLKEEIWLEQFIRKIDPFRKFLEVAAQCNGEIINVANIGRDVGVDSKTIKQYFTILEDTLMGFMLEPYQSSLRKRLHSKPKFYFFDTGVCRALNRTLTVPLRKGSADYGKFFEHFIILECVRLANYYYPDYRFSYLRTKNDVEIDLIVERPGNKTLLIEIKSSDNVKEEKLTSFSRLAGEFPNAEIICISQDKRERKVGGLMIVPWSKALVKYFVKPSVK